MNFKKVLPALAVITLSLCGLWTFENVRAYQAVTADWPMWGGTPDRNMVSSIKGLPIS